MRTCIVVLLSLLILASWIITFGETYGDKTLNLKFGFDLTQGSNGAPSLRIRDFEDSVEFNPRAQNAEHSEEHTSPRADSLSDSDDKESEKSIEGGRSAGTSGENEDDDDEYSENERQRSTRGIKPGEYEPEDNPRIHGKYGPESDSESASM